jgi:hypothetical protein
MANFIQYIGNFFFLSLAITFVLIMFLIYHYKQRISIMEQEVEKMFGIVSSVVKELDKTKTQVQQLSFIPTTTTKVSPNTNTILLKHQETDDDNDSSDSEDDDSDSESEVMQFEIHWKEDVKSSVLETVEELPDTTSEPEKATTTVEEVTTTVEEVTTTVEEVTTPENDDDNKTEATESTIVLDAEKPKYKQSMSELKKQVSQRFPNLDVQKLKKSELIRLL